MSGSSNKYPFSYIDSNGRERHFGEDDKEILITFKPQDADKVIETLTKSAPKATIEAKKLVDTGKGKPEMVTVKYLNRNTGFARVITTPGSTFSNTMKSITSSPANEVITAAIPRLREETKKGVDALVDYLPGRLAVRLKKEHVEGYYDYEKYKEQEDKEPEETQRLKFKSDYQSHCQSILNKYKLTIEKVAFSPGLFSVSFPTTQGVSETAQLFNAFEEHGKPSKESPPKLEEAAKVDGHLVGLDTGLQGPGGAGYSPDDLDPAQWGAYTTGTQHCNVLSVWRDVTRGYMNNVHVAVLDTGVDVNHPDIRVVGGTSAQNKIKKKFNAITGATTYGAVNDGDDVYSHGTNVAGIIGALTNNGTVNSISGIAHDCGLYIVRVADPDLDSIDYLDVVAGVDDVTATANAYGPAGTNNKRYVMNLSFKFSTNYGLLSTAITNAYNACVVIVAASGDQAPGVAGVDINANQRWPACYAQVIPVSAHRNVANAPRTTESDWGDDPPPGKRCIRAPGLSVPTTQRGGTIQQKSGTSIAAGFVSAAAALCWSKNRINSGGFPADVPANEAKRDDIYDALYQVWTGSGGSGDAGRLNVLNAVNAIT